MRFMLGEVPEIVVLRDFQVATRLPRAEDLAAFVTPVGNRCFKVPSQTDPSRVYDVILAGLHGRPFSCECSDFQFRRVLENQKCKHILAAELWERIQQ